MNQFIGADVEQLREQRTKLRTAAKDLESMQNRLSSQIGMAQWVGSDAEDFRSRWRGSEATFSALADSLRARGDELRDQAEDQDRASEAAPSMWDNIKSALGIGQGLFSKWDSLRKLIDDWPAHIDDWKKAFKDGPGAAWQKYKDELIKGLKKGLSFGEEYSSLAKKLASKLGLPITEIGRWDPLKKLDKIMPDFMKSNFPIAGKLAKIGGKLLPGLDIGLGIHQMINGDSAYDRVSGGLSAIGGGLTLATPLFGPAAPIVAGIGVGLGVVSIGMDVGKMIYDNREAIGNFAADVGAGISNAASAVGEGISNAAGAVGDALGGLGNALGFGR